MNRSIYLINRVFIRVFLTLPLKTKNHDFNIDTALIDDERGGSEISIHRATNVPFIPYYVTD